MSEQPSSVGDAPEPGGKVIKGDFRRRGDGESRPVIEITRGELPRMVRQAIGALARDPNLFQRDGELVTITRQPKRQESTFCPGRDDLGSMCTRCGADAGEDCAPDVRRGSSIITRPGTPLVRPIGGTLTLRAAEQAEWLRWDPKAGEKVGKGKPSGEMVPADPDEKTMRLVADSDDYPGIRPLRSIVESPAIAPSGRIISEAGYDRETALFMLPAFEMDPIPEYPTQAESAECMSFLWRNLYGDFPFADVGESDPKDADRSNQYGRALKVPGAFVGLASVLTVLARTAIIGAVPGFIYEAATPGSGKSMQMHLTALLTTGRPAGVMTFPMKAGDPNEEELEKILSGYALGGARLISFDNITGNLGGPALDKVLTAVDSIDLRKLGESPVTTHEWIAVTQYSGNNMTMSSDIARRSMVSRLVSSHESPSKRPASDFLHPRLLAWTRANLPKLVRCALVILRAFWVAKDKPQPGERGGFEEWCGLIPGAIMYAGGPNVLKAWAEEEMAASGGDEMATAHGSLLALWPFQTPIKAGEVLAYAFKNEFEIQRGATSDGLEDLREAIRTICKSPNHVPKASPFGAALAKLRDKIRNGAMLVRKMDGKGIALWSIERRGQVAAAAAQVPARVTPPVETVASATTVAVAVCEACGQPRGYGPGRCNPCQCGGCCDVPEGVRGACGCSRYP